MSQNQIWQIFIVCENTIGNMKEFNNIVWLKDSCMYKLGCLFMVLWFSFVIVLHWNFLCTFSCQIHLYWNLINLQLNTPSLEFLFVSNVLLRFMQKKGFKSSKLDQLTAKIIMTEFRPSFLWHVFYPGFTSWMP